MKYLIDLSKSMIHKYIKRTGTPGHYKYYYKNMETGKIEIHKKAMRTPVGYWDKEAIEARKEKPVVKRKAVKEDVILERKKKKKEKKISATVKKLRTDKYKNERPADVKNVGEDIAGARRHQYCTYDLDKLEDDGVASKYINKKFLFGDYKETFDLDKEINNGNEPAKAMLVYAIKKTFTNKPYEDSKEARKLYHTMANAVISVDANTKTLKDFVDGYFEIIGPALKPDKWGVPNWTGKFDPRDVIRYETNKLGTKLVNVLCGWKGPLRWGRSGYKDDRLKELFTNEYIKERGELESGDKVKKGDIVVLKEGHEVRPTRVYSQEKYMTNKEEIDKLYKERVEVRTEVNALYKTLIGISNNTPEKEAQWKLVKENAKKIDTISSKLSDLQYKKITFESTATVLSTRKDKLFLMVLDEDGKEHKVEKKYEDIDLKESVARSHTQKGKTPNLYTTGKVERKGGKEITGNVEQMQKILTTQAKFRGLQYGNYVTDEEREYHTKKTVEAFTDLATALDIPFDKLTMNGRLAISFGANGKAHALAHYEPGTKKINLTRCNGFGSLAHEWGHFLDNVLHNIKDPGRNGFCSEDYKTSPDSPIQREITELTNYAYEAMKDDLAGYQPYWSRRAEILARCFESYMADTMHKKKLTNTYLVAMKKTTHGDDARKIYPQAELRTELNKRFDSIFSQLSKSDLLDKALKYFITLNK
jgi:hypothetical protein